MALVSQKKTIVGFTVLWWTTGGVRYDIPCCAITVVLQLQYIYGLHRESFEKSCVNVHNILS